MRAAGRAGLRGHRRLLRPRLGQRPAAGDAVAAREAALQAQQDAVRAHAARLGRPAAGLPLRQAAHLRGGPARRRAALEGAGAGRAVPLDGTAAATGDRGAQDGPSGAVPERLDAAPRAAVARGALRAHDLAGRRQGERTGRLATPVDTERPRRLVRLPGQAEEVACAATAVAWGVRGGVLRVVDGVHAEHGDGRVRGAAQVARDARGECQAQRSAVQLHQAASRRASNEQRRPSVRELTGQVSEPQSWSLFKWKNQRVRQAMSRHWGGQSPAR
ncbi:hypothetical protein ON010_g4759 [Phytophthora cinnamomi]|nr:hypothetical protein ON010_g4759 [Phytophthora cinnamomi]